MRTLSKSFFALFLLLFAFTGASQVASDYAAGTSFTGYKTYNLTDQVIGFPDEINPINVQRIENAIHAEMESKGYVLSENPDL